MDLTGVDMFHSARREQLLMRERGKVKSKVFQFRHPPFYGLGILMPMFSHQLQAPLRRDDQISYKSSHVSPIPSFEISESFFISP